MIQTLADLLQRAGAAGGTAFWLPLLFWTLAALPLYGLLRAWRGLHPLTQYGAHVALLLALPAAFALIPLLPSPAVEPPAAVSGLLDFADDPVDMPTAPLVLPAAPLILPAEPPPVRWSLLHLLGGLTLAAGGLTLVSLLRLVHHAYALRRYRRKLQPLADGPMQEAAQELAHRLGLRRPVTLLQGETGTVPMTFGVRRPVIVLPAALAEDLPALRMALEHELIHVRRHDYLLGCAERLVGSLFAIHPLVWLLQRGAEHYREISCDAELLTGRDVVLSAYARLLFRFHQHGTPAHAGALPIARPTSNLRQRIQAMKQFRHVPLHARQRRASLVATAGLLLGATLFSACFTKVSNNEVSRNEIPSNEVSARTFVLPMESPRVAQVGTELKRLEIQMGYLKDQIKSASEELGKAKAESGNLDFELAQQRFDLLRGLYTQRLEAFETLKMEQLTLAELGVEQLYIQYPDLRNNPSKNPDLQNYLSQIEQLKHRISELYVEKVVREMGNGNAQEVHENVDQMPEPLPNAQDALGDLQKQIRYPEIARKAGVEGRVVVEFVVDEQGKVTAPRVVESLGAGCDEEALRIVQTLAFRPGRQDGTPVKVVMKLPFTFKLDA